LTSDLQPSNWHGPGRMTRLQILIPCYSPALVICSFHTLPYSLLLQLFCHVYDVVTIKVSCISFYDVPVFFIALQEEPILLQVFLFWKMVIRTEMAVG